MDWNTIAVWAAGITTVLGSIIGAGYLALQKIVKVAQEGPQPKNDVKVYTTDTAAYQAMTNTMIALTAAINSLADLIREEQQETKIETEVERRLRLRTGTGGTLHPPGR